MKNKHEDQSVTLRDYELMQVTLTVAVSTLVCDDHEDLRHTAAIETLISAFTQIAHMQPDSDIVVLTSKFEPMTATKQIAQNAKVSR